jgi:hypothetical protein
VTNESQFLELVHSKAVAVVGTLPPDPATNDYDLIVHVNRHWLDHRGRCDILYHNCCTDAFVQAVLSEMIVPPKVIVGNGAPYAKDGCAVAREYCEKHGVLFLAPSHEQFYKTNPLGPEHEWLNVFRKRYMFFPFQGILAAYHLLLHPVRKVFLTGQTLFYDEQTGGFPPLRGPHDITTHLRFMRDLLRSDSRVELDGRFQQAIMASKIDTRPPPAFNVARLAQLADAVAGTVTLDEVEEAARDIAQEARLAQQFAAALSDGQLVEMFTPEEFVEALLSRLRPKGAGKPNTAVA